MSFVRIVNAMANPDTAIGEMDVCAIQEMS